MATVPLKIYKTRLPGGFADPKDQWAYTINSGYNTPFGYEESSLDDFMANASSRNQNTAINELNAITKGNYSLNNLGQAFTPEASPFRTDSQGRLTTAAAVQEQASLANDPNMQNVGTKEAPLYVPKGSAGAQNLEEYGGTNNFSLLANSGKIPGISAASPINSQTLTPPTPLSYSVPPSSPVPDITKIDPSGGLEMTQPEKKATDLTSKITELNDALAGKASYQSQQEQQYGIPEQLKVQNDLTSQLKALQAEAASIPMKLQEESVRRGISTTILGRQQEKLLRENSIKALGISAMLEASRGNLAFAYDQVDRAVATKFGPIEAEIKAKRANLELIINSPEYSLEDKKRALAQNAIQDEKEQELKKRKADQEDVWGIAIDAAQNGADSRTLQKIQRANSPSEALQIATDAGLLRDTRIVQLPDKRDVLVDNRGNVLKVIGGGSTPSGTSPSPRAPSGITPAPTRVATQSTSVQPTGPYIPAYPNEIIAWAQDIVAGKTKITAVPSAIRTTVQNAVADLQAQKQSSTQQTGFLSRVASGIFSFFK